MHKITQLLRRRPYARRLKNASAQIELQIWGMDHYQPEDHNCSVTQLERLCHRTCIQDSPEQECMNSASA